MTTFQKNINKYSKFRTLSLAMCGLGLLVLATSNLFVNAATFTFNPSSSVLLAGCRSSVNIDANATGQTSNAADIEVQYNPSEINILDSDTSIPGIQIRTGNAYETYFGNEVTPSLSRIRLAGASFVGNLTTRRTFATIQFQSRPGVTSTSFQINFNGVGATLDSNIADSSTSDDLLSSVTNGSYTFRTDFCEVDREPPVIINQTPKAYDTGVAANSRVTVQITDNQAGVDLGNTIFYINSDVYNANDPAVSYTGSALNYTFVITPRNPIPTNEASTLRVSTQDLVQNRSNNQIIFNIPPTIIEQIICPAFLNPNGTSGTGVNGGGRGNGVTGGLLPSTGGSTIRTGGYSEEVISQLKEELDDEKSAVSLLSSTPLDNSLLNNFVSKPIFGNLDIIKSLEASLKALQYFSLISFFILILAILNLFLSDKKREIKGYAINSKKEILAGAKIELFNLVSLLKELEYYSENDGEYIFKVEPGAYEVRFVDNGKDYSEIIIMPEIRPTVFLGKTLNQEKNNKILQRIAQVWFVVKLIFAKLSPGILFVGTAIAFINLVILTTAFNLLVFIAYIAIIGTVWVPKLIRYTAQVISIK